MTTTITFEVVGDPVAQARPRAVRVGKGIRMYNTKPVETFRTLFNKRASEAMNGKPLFDVPLMVILDVYIQRPKSWKKSRIHADRKPDCDNFAKLALDSMEGVIYTNDSRIVSLCVEKHLSDRPRCEVRVEVLE